MAPKQFPTSLFILRTYADTAGVEKSPSFPICTSSIPFAQAILIMMFIASLLKYRPSPPKTNTFRAEFVKHSFTFQLIRAQSQKYGLHEICQIVWLLKFDNLVFRKNEYFFSKARGTWLLSVVDVCLLFKNFG